MDLEGYLKELNFKESFKIYTCMNMKQYLSKQVKVNRFSWTNHLKGSNGQNVR